MGSRPCRGKCGRGLRFRPGPEEAGAEQVRWLPPALEPRGERFGVVPLPLDFEGKDGDRREREGPERQDLGSEPSGVLSRLFKLVGEDDEDVEHHIGQEFPHKCASHGAVHVEGRLPHQIGPHEEEIEDLAGAVFNDHVADGFDDGQPYSRGPRLVSVLAVLEGDLAPTRIAVVADGLGDSAGDSHSRDRMAQMEDYPRCTHGCDGSTDLGAGIAPDPLEELGMLSGEHWFSPQESKFWAGTLSVIADEESGVNSFSIMLMF